MPTKEQSVTTFEGLECQQLQDRLAEMCNEAAELRASAGESSTEETLTDLHERLIRCRQAQDRIEEILGKLVRLRGIARKQARARKDELEDQLSQIIRASRPVEFSSVREREARYDVDAFEQKRAWRNAERTLANVEMAHEFVTLVYRGIDSARRDVEVRVRLVSLDSRLE